MPTHGALLKKEMKAVLAQVVRCCFVYDKSKKYAAECDQIWRILPLWKKLGLLFGKIANLLWRLFIILSKFSLLKTPKY